MNNKNLEVKIMDHNLKRFESEHENNYNNALSEVRNGRKISHWMWYIFPQAYGLGHSYTANYYGIRCIDEAKAYLADPILGPHLVEISEALMELEDKDAEKIFGFPDDLKLRSCMTLFAAVSDENSVFQQVLDAYYHGEKDERTIEFIKQSSEYDF